MTKAKGSRARWTPLRCIDGAVDSASLPNGSPDETVPVWIFVPAAGVPVVPALYRSTGKNFFYSPATGKPLSFSVGEIAAWTHRPTGRAPSPPDPAATVEVEASDQV